MAGGCRKGPPVVLLWLHIKISHTRDISEKAVEKFGTMCYNGMHIGGIVTFLRILEVCE